MKCSFWKKRGKDSLGFKENMKNFKWQVTDEFKAIVGYKTQKAVTHFKGRESVA